MHMYVIFNLRQMGSELAPTAQVDRLNTDNLGPFYSKIKRFTWCFHPPAKLYKLQVSETKRLTKHIAAYLKRKILSKTGLNMRLSRSMIGCESRFYK